MSATNSERFKQQIDKSCYVHDMPSEVRRPLCHLLDAQNLWESLAYKIGFNKRDINSIKYKANYRHHSPTAYLLDWWSNYKHTVTELFMALYSLKIYRAMEYLRELVDPAYHRLIVKDQNAREHDSAKHNWNNIVIHGIPQISHGELKTATMQWSNASVLGRGGFSTVYCGKWKCTDVAIKRIHCQNFNLLANKTKQKKQIITELHNLNLCRHDNILPLYGYSIDGSEPCLVYQFMPGGSLECRLRNKNAPLSIKQRVNICQGTARGLHYLHTFGTRPLIHCDIKPANILLDMNCQPKIGDFGIAREGSVIGPVEISKVCGTFPYMPPELLKHQVISTKTDCYGFGVVILQLVTGMQAYDRDRGKFAALVDYVRASCESVMQNQYSLIASVFTTTISSHHITNTLIQSGLWCTRNSADERPEMSKLMQLFKDLD